jgi:hypothetical protein
LVEEGSSGIMKDKPVFLVCSTEDFILDPRAELLKTRTCDPDQDKGGCLPKGE